MKKISIIFSVCFITLSAPNANAQTWSGSSVSTTTTGNVAIQGGQIDLTVPGDGSDRYIIGSSTTKSLHIMSGNPGSPTVDGAGISLNAVNCGGPTAGGAIYVVTPGAYNSGTFFVSESTGSAVYNMSVLNNGKVAIGTNLVIGAQPLPDGYLLYVNQGILTEKVNVAIAGSANWSDFVFNKDYNLMPLMEVENYVNENKHLPEVPAATDVVKDGIDVAKMDAKLLQKIEELTLYAIAEQKESKKLQKIVAQQQVEIKELKKGLKK